MGVERSYFVPLQMAAYSFLSSCPSARVRFWERGSDDRQYFLKLILRGVSVLRTQSPAFTTIASMAARSLRIGQMLHSYPREMAALILIS